MAGDKPLSELMVGLVIGAYLHQSARRVKVVFTFLLFPGKCSCSTSQKLRSPFARIMFCCGALYNLRHIHYVYSTGAEAYNSHYPTPGFENQWIWAVVSKGVDSTGHNLHIGYNTLICISVPRRACVFMAFMPYLATQDLLLMPKMNGMYRLYDSFNNPLLYWLHNAVCSKYSLDKITKREIIKRLFCHVTHGDMTSQLDITWQRGKTPAKHFFTSVWKLANGMAQNHISWVNLSALYA